MNPTRLRLRNVRRFHDLDINLPTGAVALVGGNGAGKSSLLNAIDIALFADRGELNDLITTGEDRLEIELTFEHAGEVYRVRRQVKRGKSPSVDFERLQLDPSETIVVDGDGEHLEHLGAFVPLTRENANATGQLICETLGLTRKTFRASSFLKQGDTAAFTEADPASRKALLAEILRLNLWDDADGRKAATERSLLGLARNDLRVAEQKLPGIDARVEQITQLLVTRDGHERTLAAYRVQLQKATDELTVAERRLEQAQEAKASNQAAAERLRACQAELDAATAEVRRAQTELADAAAAAERRAELQEQLNAAAAQAAEIPTLEEQLEQHRARAITTAQRDQLVAEAEQLNVARERMIAEAHRLLADARELKRKAGAIESQLDHAGECDRCGQTLGAEAAKRAVESYQREAAQIEERAGQIIETSSDEAGKVEAIRAQAAAIEIPKVDGDPALIREQLNGARAAGERRATIAEQLRQAAELAARAPALQTRVEVTLHDQIAKLAAVDEARKSVGDTTKLDGDVNIARAGVDVARRAETEAREAIARTEQTLEQLTAAAADREALIGERAMVQTRIERLRVAVAAYGRNGIPALIVEAVAVPQIEQEANRLLQMMPTERGETFQVQLRTQRELKGNDGDLRDALDIVVFDGEGERAYETYSEGEHGRLNLCLRIALARLLAHRRGAESRLFAIDEIPFMDKLGQRQIVEVIEDILAAGTFDRILVIGHEDIFRESFEQTISIVDVGGRSVVDNAAVEVLA